MRPLRALLILVVIGGGLAASLVLVPKAIRSLHSSPLLRATPTKPYPAGRDSRPHSLRRHSHAATAHTTTKPTATRFKARAGVGILHDGTLKLAALELAGALALIGALLLALAGGRVRRQRRREYALYELQLSTHDQAKHQDLEDMVESIANIVRAWPAERVRHGQPYLALELICGGAPRPDGGQEMEWSINVRCEPRAVAALDGAVSAAYPDVRLGRAHGQQPRPRAGAVRELGYVIRFRKERSFVYSLIADGEEEASSPLEQVARAQVALGVPSIVRFQLTPTPSFFEELARRLYRRHENKLVRQERWGLPEGGLWSTFNQAEMHAAERTQNRSLFWLEAVIAADTAQGCKTIAAAVQSRRGENRLHRRWMIIRQRLYRHRFPRAVGPLIPSLRSLVSAAEVAHLLELPSARMKGVPVRRVTIPRIPAPPEATRASHPRDLRPSGQLVNGAAVRPGAALTTREQR